MLSGMRLSNGEHVRIEVSPCGFVSVYLIEQRKIVLKLEELLQCWILVLA